jgi:ferric-dicitrate binding protein FerR (iron transport regulator)
MVTKNILFEYFVGNATVLQKRMIENWLESEPNRILYYEWLTEWEREFPQYIPEVEHKLEHYLLRIEKYNKHKLTVAGRHDKKSVFPMYRYTGYVAGLLLLLAATLTYLNADYFFNNNLSTGFGEIKEVRLPDGSELTLYANSNISWNAFDFENNRLVYLDGEANFKIHHQQEGTKFRVKSKNGVIVVVYGTEFRFFSRERGSKIELNKGIIKLHYREGKKNKVIALSPGEYVSLNMENKLTERKRFNPIRNLEIKKHRFVFSNTPLSELKTLIYENFGLGIVIPDKDVEKLTLSGTYTGNSLNELINSLSAVTGLNIYKHHGRIYIVPYSF